MNNKPKILINRNLSLTINICDKDNLMCAIGRLDHSHDLDVSETGSVLLITGDDYDILTLLYQLTVVGAIELT